jgi:acetyltransferase
LHPYPEKLSDPSNAGGWNKLLLRPIKPEDEPLWLAMIGRCSKDSLYSRFRYFFHWQSHEAATRYCYNDYDREIAIVAELT